jgi:hypothetical protein
MASTSAQLSTQSALQSSNLASLKPLGSSISSQATASFTWTDLYLDAAHTVDFTNAICSSIAPYLASDQSSVQASLINDLVRTLPVLAPGIDLTSDLTCGPRNPLQSRHDQPAAFSVSLTLTAVYSLFAANASYVDFPSAINSSLLGSETTAPLRLSAVRSSVESALGRVGVALYKTAQCKLCLYYAFVLC